MKMKKYNLTVLIIPCLFLSAAAQAAEPLSGAYKITSSSCFGGQVKAGDKLTINAEANFFHYELGSYTADGSAFIANFLNAAISTSVTGGDGPASDGQRVKLSGAYSKGGSVFDYTETNLKYSQLPEDQVIRSVHFEKVGKVIHYRDNSTETCMAE